MKGDLLGGIERQGLEGIDREENGLVASHPGIDFAFHVSLSMNHWIEERAVYRTVYRMEGSLQSSRRTTSSGSSRRDDHCTVPPFCLAVTIVPSSRRPVTVEPLADSYNSQTLHLVPRTLGSSLRPRRLSTPTGGVPPPFRLRLEGIPVCPMTRNRFLCDSSTAHHPLCSAPPSHLQRAPSALACLRVYRKQRKRKEWRVWVRNLLAWKREWRV